MDAHDITPSLILDASIRASYVLDKLELEVNDNSVNNVMDELELEVNDNSVNNVMDELEWKCMMTA